MSSALRLGSLLASATTAWATGSFRLRQPSTAICESVGAGHMGYYDFDSDRKHLYFWLAESRHDPGNDPLVLWMSGGPGASSVGFGGFDELGPCLIADNTTSRGNPYAWNERANILFVDQPVGAGYSYANGSAITSVDDAMEDMYDFLTALLEHLPQYAQQKFYIFGESYGGTWVPAMARKIHQKQSSAMAKIVDMTTSIPRTHINLRGIGLGNAQLSQSSQWPGFYQTGCTGPSPIFNATTCASIEENTPICDGLLGVCEPLMSDDPNACDEALAYCREKTVMVIMDEHLNPYDFRQGCEGLFCFEDLIWIPQYLNSTTTKEIFGVDESTPFHLVDFELNMRFATAGESNANSVSWAEELLDQGYDVLVYAGNKDWFCNADGEKRLVHRMRWKHQAAFQAARYEDFKMGDTTIGALKRSNGLSFVEVYDAGHMVPSSKPEEALYLLDWWLGSVAG